MSQQPVNFPDHRGAERTFHDALQALRNGSRYQARKWALRSIELNPKKEEPWLILAAVSSPHASIDYLQTALQINPDSERAWQGFQWALDRLQKVGKETQSQPVVGKTRPLPTRPIQEQSLPLSTTLAQDHSPVLHAKLFPDNSVYQSEADLWQIDFTKINDPGKFVFEFILNGFFTAFHQITMPWTGMGVMHNHTFRLQVTASAEFVTHDNRVIVSYTSIQTVVDEICKIYEGKTLNDLPPFKQLQPTTENLVGVIVQQMEKLSSGKQFKIYEVTLMESPSVGVVYKNMNVIRIAP